MKSTSIQKIALAASLIAFPAIANAEGSRTDLPSCEASKAMIDDSNKGHVTWSKQVCKCRGDLADLLDLANISQTEYDKSCKGVSVKPPKQSSVKTDKTKNKNRCKQVWDGMEEGMTCEEAKKAKMAILDAKCSFGPRSTKRYETACADTNSESGNKLLVILMMLGSIIGSDILLKLFAQKRRNFIKRVDIANDRFHKANGSDPSVDIETGEKLTEAEEVAWLSSFIKGPINNIRSYPDLYKRRIEINKILAELICDDVFMEPPKIEGVLGEKGYYVLPNTELATDNKTTSEEPEEKTMSIETLLAIINDDDEDDDDDEW